jgi:hypothetical protein
MLMFEAKKELRQFTRDGDPVSLDPETLVRIHDELSGYLARQPLRMRGRAIAQIIANVSLQGFNRGRELHGLPWVGDPIVYGASLDEVLTRQIIPRLRGTCLDDEPGTMHPSPVHWRPHRATTADEQNVPSPDSPPPTPPPEPVRTTSLAEPAHTVPSPPGWHADIVLHEVHDENGRFRGLASYGPEEMDARALALPHVPSLTTYTAWHADAAGEMVPVKRQLPFGENTFHWFSYGTAGRFTAATRGDGTRSLEADELVELIESRLGGFTDIAMWSRQTESAVDRAATLALAARVGELTGRRVHVPEWETAFDLDPATGKASAHTYADPEGGETGWSSASPRPATSSEPGGVFVELPVRPGAGETFGGALTRALNANASLLPERDESLAEGATPVDRFFAGLTEEDLELKAGQRAQAVLQSGRLPVASLGLDHVQRFRLAMETEPATSETWAEMTAALDAAARRLGVRIVLSEALPAGDDQPVVPGHAEGARSLADDAYRMLSGPASASTSRSSEPAPVYPIRTERWSPLRASRRGEDRPGEDAFALTWDASGRPTVTRGAHSGVRQLVHYNLVPTPGKWSFRLRLHLKAVRGATRADVARASGSASAAAEEYFNGPGRVLPGTDARMSVSVEFVDDPGAAYRVVEVLPGVPGPGDRMNQGRWFAEAPLHAFAHELAHFLGVRDSHRTPRALLRPTAPAAWKPGDLMGDVHADEGAYVLLEEHLAEIVQVAAPYLPPRPDLFRGGDGHRPQEAGEFDSALDLLPEINRALLVTENQEAIVEIEPGLTVYRAVKEGPEEVFARGLEPNDLDNMISLVRHIGSSGRSQFVSTTHDKTYRHKNRRYVYTIHTSEPGIDVAETLKSRGLPYSFSWEKEVAFTGTIPTEDIVEVRDMVTGEVTKNPNYRPRDEKRGGPRNKRDMT